MTRDTSGDDEADSAATSDDDEATGSGTENGYRARRKASTGLSEPVDIMGRARREELAERAADFEGGEDEDRP